MGKQSHWDKYRSLKAAANSGGPGYRSTDTGKGDVNRTRGVGLTRFELGMELMEVADEFGHDSPEYAAKLGEWRNAQA